MIDTSVIPKNPGCYLFKDESDNIIYIGKAKVLRNRVKSYFQSKELDPKTEALLQNIASVDFIVTANEVEALVLENNLIKKNRPKYNIDLKDAKRYAYILITAEKFPRMLIARKREGPGKFFGPFVSAVNRNYLMDYLKKAFYIRTCKRMPKKACLRWHIGLCHAPCIGKITEEDYGANIRKVELILNGKTGELTRELKTEMKSASDKMYYERALDMRNQLEAIEWLKEKQNVERKKRYNEDIINYIVKNDRVYLILFNVYKGTLENKQQFEFEYNPEFLEEFIIQYYSDNPVPGELILPVKVDETLIEYLEKMREGVVKVKVPQKGEKRKLMELVLKNVEASFFGHLDKLEDLQDKLDLQEIPTVIECFDISHLSGTSMVGSMVQFRNGKPDKSNYRRFRIKTVEEIDDYAALTEVVRRRYTRLLNEKTEMPNLVIIDGGLGQLNAALEVLKELNLKIPVISIAKRLEEIYVPGYESPLSLSKKSGALQMIQQLRDEAHRFAIKYHKLLRKKVIIES
jgi:excinuclease ABC subunit C